MSPPPFFICGNDRSGTTMLRLMLDRGPDVAIPPESMFLMDVERPAGDGPQTWQSLLEELWRHPKVRLWGLSDPPPRVPSGLGGDDAFRFALEAPFRAYARKFGKPRWADKTPPYVHYVDRILGVWPRARFVVLVRDGRDVALSVRPLPFGPNNAWAAAQWWARGIRAGLAARRQHPDRVMIVRYEDLVDDPGVRLREICDFVEVPFSDDMLRLQDADPGRIVADQRSWFPGIFEGVSRSSSGRWRREMSLRDQRIFASLAGDELAAHGYPVPATPVRGVGPLEAGLLDRHNETMRNINFLRLRLLQERGRELRLALRRRIADRARRG